MFQFGLLANYLSYFEMSVTAFPFVGCYISYCRLNEIVLFFAGHILHKV
jgi:hypothetical protein